MRKWGGRIHKQVEDYCKKGRTQRGKPLDRVEEEWWAQRSQQWINENQYLKLNNIPPFVYSILATIVVWIVTGIAVMIVEWDPEAEFLGRSDNSIRRFLLVKRQDAGWKHVGRQRRQNKTKWPGSQSKDQELAAEILRWYFTKLEISKNLHKMFFVFLFFKKTTLLILWLFSLLILCQASIHFYLQQLKQLLDREKCRPVMH